MTISYIKPDGLTYCEYIDLILSSRENVRPKDVYMEKHHIVPKCMGGGNESGNLIYLYAQEHYEAHKLLALENPDNYRLQFAWNNMTISSKSFQERNISISEEEYALIRKARSKAQSDMMKGFKPSQAAIDRIIALNKSRNYKNPETKEKIRRLNIEKLEKYRATHPHPCLGRKYTEEQKRKCSLAHKGIPSKHNKPVMCIETGEIYRSVTHASKAIGRDRHSLRDALQDQTKTCAKMHWQFIDKKEVI